VIDELMKALVYQDGPQLWMGRLELVLFGRTWTLRLSIEGDGGAPPSAQQRVTLEAFLSKQRAVEEDVERRVYSFYEATSPEYRRTFDSVTAQQLVPAVSVPEEMSRVVTPTDIYVPASHEGSPNVLLLLFDCTWDESHGLGVKLVDLQVKEVAEQQALL
jgi:hypothetical protein